MPPSAAAPVRGVHVQTCASPGADVRTRQGPPTRAAVRRNALRGERVRLRSERQGRIRLPPVCRQTKRHAWFPRTETSAPALPSARAPLRTHSSARHDGRLAQAAARQHTSPAAPASADGVRRPRCDAACRPPARASCACAASTHRHEVVVPLDARLAHDGRADERRAQQRGRSTRRVRP